MADDTHDETQDQTPEQSGPPHATGAPPAPEATAEVPPAVASDLPTAPPLAPADDGPPPSGPISAPTSPEPPTQPVAVSEAWAPVPVAPDPAPGAAARRAILVPLWVFVLVGLLVLAGGAFAVGRATADDHEEAAAVVEDGGRVARAPQRVVAPRGSVLGVTAADGDGGVRVVTVQNGSAADDAGLRAGDVITKFGNDSLTTVTELRRRLAAHDPDDDLTLTVRRDGDTRTVKVQFD